jgi:hypothetical protein
MKFSPKANCAALLALILFVSCGGDGASSSDNPTLADDDVLKGAAVPAPVQFVDEAVERGVTLEAIAGDLEKEHILETLGCGLAIGDYDNDGDQDLYVVTSQTSENWIAGKLLRSNALYRNDGGGRFVDVAAEAGVALSAWSLGAYFGDYDNDGDKDLFVTNWGANSLFENNGDGTFTDVSVASGLDRGDGWSTSAAFSDLDNDGDLDIYVANYAKYSLVDPPLSGATMTWRGVRVFMGPVGLEGEPDRLYRNNGDGTFSDVTEQSGLTSVANPHYGLGVVIADLDRDGDADIFVANDTMANFLWVNQGDFRFEERALSAGVATDQNAREQAGMGVDAADYDGDGLIDLVVTNFSHDFNTLHKNRGELRFSDATYQANFKDSYKYLVWGTKFFDFDLDGWIDVFMANGHIYSVLETYSQANTSYRQQNSLYHNRGDGSFVPVADNAGSGMRIEQSSRGMAVGDLDNDGDVDFVVTNIDGKPNLMINQGRNENGSLTLTLEGRASNRDAIGARVELVVDGRTQTREVNPFGSFLSQSSHDLIFGLAAAESAESLVVTWPSGTVDRLGPVAAGRWRLIEGSGEVQAR